MTIALGENTEKETAFFNKYSTSPIDDLHFAEMKLFKIFEDELHSTNSILLDYRPQTIYKLAKFITGKILRSVSIGIAGETASGKSTITQDMINTIHLFEERLNLENLITRVNTDDYYYDRSKEVKEAGGIAEFAKGYDFDVPEALELDLMYTHIKKLLSGVSVMLPKYDMSGTTKRWDNHTLAEPSKVIISEGLFTLTEKVRDAFDFKIYVDVDNEIQKERFFIRAKERGLGACADSIYRNASEKAKYYIRPCRFHSDVVLSGEAHRTRYKIFLNKILALIEEMHF